MCISGNDSSNDFLNLSQSKNFTLVDTSFADSQRTGFYYHVKKIMTASTFVVSLLGTASLHLDAFSIWEENTIQSFNQSESLECSSFEDQSAYEQIGQIRRSLGVNILELATILSVSRPTIYEWIESKKISVRKENQKRLNAIYEISIAWKSKNIGVLSSYLRRSFGASNKSLFDLLKKNKLDMATINRYLDNIAQVILTKRKADEAEEALLKKHGFKPVNKEDMEDRLNDIDF